MSMQNIKMAFRLVREVKRTQKKQLKLEMDFERKFRS